LQVGETAALRLRQPTVVASAPPSCSGDVRRAHAEENGLSVNLSLQQLLSATIAAASSTAWLAAGTLIDRLPQRIFDIIRREAALASAAHVQAGSSIA
jgi:hypothetical protein